MVDDVSTRYTAGLTEFGRNAVMAAFFTGVRVPELWLMLTTAPVNSTDSVNDERELDDYYFDPVSGAITDTGYRRALYEMDDGWGPGEPGSFYNTRELVFGAALIDWVPAEGWALVTGESEDADLFAIGSCEVFVDAGEQLVIPQRGIGFTLEGG